MYFLIIQLYRIEYKDDLLLALTSCGIQKGSLFDGLNLDMTLQQDFPLFSGFVKSDDEKARYSVLITTVVESQEKVGELLALLKEADIDVEKEQILRLILLPAQMVIDNDLNWVKPE